MNNPAPTRSGFGLISLFIRHKLAANLLMLLMLLLGVLALFRLNVQFFPNFELDYVQVRVIWPSANAEDVEKSLTEPLERVLRNIDHLDEMSSTSSLGASLITLKFMAGTNMIEATDQVRQRVSELRNLPQDIQTPVIERLLKYETIAKVLVLGETGEEAQLHRLVKQFERELLDAGIEKISFRGRPLQEMAIEVAPETLASYQLNLTSLANQIAAQSRDIPAGKAGDADAAKDIRAIKQARNEHEFAEITIRSSQTENLKLGDLAEISLRPQQESTYLKVDGRPAIEMILQRAETADTLKSSKIMQTWLENTQNQLPQGVEIKVYDETWALVKERIMLLVDNGISGLVLVLLVLYFFLNGRVAFWVALGIPISFMATLMVVYLAGGSLDMMSLFALIMALGIIVDDAIVVGEDTLTHYDKTKDGTLAAEAATNRMLMPVVASALTTVAAFIPLMYIGGEIGAILFAIPLVMISVILISLVQCFFVLPGQLKFGLRWFDRGDQPKLRDKWDNAFDRFRQNQFRNLIRWVLGNRGLTLALAGGVIILTVGLIAGGRLSFTFFPTPESNRITATIQFVAGTPEEQTAKYIDQVYQALLDTEKELEPGLVATAVVAYNQGVGSSAGIYGQIVVELIDPDKRKTRNGEFMRVWREKAGDFPGLENFNLVALTGGPPGRDIEVQFTGASPEKLKQASLDLQQALTQLSGVSGISDDLPYGRQQMVFELTPNAKALGFTYAEIGSQLASFFAGRLVQIYTDNEDEIEVRVMLPKADRQEMAILNRLQLDAPNGEKVLLDNLVEWRTQQGFDVMRHYNGQLAVTVLADVDETTNNANQIRQDLTKYLLPELAQTYGLNYSMEGTAKNQKKTMADMLTGLILGVVLIYLILAWVFESYSWPILIMLAIPLGLIGAILGHYFMGIGLTILSMFGFFALAGVVVNNSIILASFYKLLREQGMAVDEALEEASVNRLRAVLVTSLTTVGGLIPLMFETSLQAQFLIPMAVSIAFGLMFATLLILLILPALLSLFEQAKFSVFQAWNRKVKF